MKNLIVSNLEIPFDSEGRMSLNALHKASGGEKRHQPQYWLASKSTQELIEIYKGRNSSLLPVNVQQGRNGGTFAIEELAFDYAYWISAEFKVQVCEDVKAYHRDESKPPRLAADERLRAANVLADCLGLSMQARRDVLAASCKALDMPDEFNALPFYSHEGVQALGQAEGTRPAKALMDLLAENGVMNAKTGEIMSPQAFNGLLIEAGIAEQRYRRGKLGTAKKDCVALVEGFEKYGHLPKSKYGGHQPHYYEDTFLELVGLVRNPTDRVKPYSR